MYDRYKEIREKQGYKDSDVAKATGIAKATLSDWKNGKTTPKTDKLEKIADFLGVSLDYLKKGKEKEYPEFNPEHIELIKLYSKLNEEQKKTVMTMLRSLAPQD